MDIAATVVLSRLRSGCPTTITPWSIPPPLSEDSWDFFRMVCSLLRDRRKYDEVFRRMQLDPVYPYLNSMTGLNDPGDDVAMGGNSGADKPLAGRVCTRAQI
jgi:hypothetical protein